MRTLVACFSAALFAGACGGASAQRPPSTSTPQTATLSYFVRASGQERLLGTLAVDGTVTRNPELPTGDPDMDGATLSKALSVRLDGDGRPASIGSKTNADGPTIDWSLGDDGSLTWRLTPPAALASAPLMFKRGVRVLPDGRAFLPALGISYLLRDDGTVAQRFADGREEVEPRWRLQGAVGANKRRAMVALVILDDFFDVGGGVVQSTPASAPGHTASTPAPPASASTCAQAAASVGAFAKRYEIEGGQRTNVAETQ